MNRPTFTEETLEILNAAHVAKEIRQHSKAALIIAVQELRADRIFLNEERRAELNGVKKAAYTEGARAANSQARNLISRFGQLNGNKAEDFAQAICQTLVELAPPPQRSSAESSYFTPTKR